MATGELKVSDRGDNQHAIEYIPETTENWESDYFSVSGYFGDYGPHLFKAAPELYEALESLATCVEDGCYCSEMKMAAAIDNARAVLAKARGE